MKKNAINCWYPECVIDKYHAWVNAEFLLEKCLVGTLDESEGQQRAKEKK